jgi:imidazolonepropionase-like amidohydrolase
MSRAERSFCAAPRPSRCAARNHRERDILINDNRIAAVGPAGSLAIPPQAEIRDVSGKYVVPGLVDTHAHWFQIRRQLPDIGHWNFLAYLAYGVTAGLDVQTFTVDTFVYQDLIDAGRMLGPRAFSTGPGIFTDSEIHEEADALDVMRRYRDHRTRNLNPIWSATGASGSWSWRPPGSWA